MKKILLMLVASGSLMNSAHAGCWGKALDAALDQYGNDPRTTSIKASNNVFHVSVGHGNVEDGIHYYEVTFPGGCDGKASVKEIAGF